MYDHHSSTHNDTNYMVKEYGYAMQVYIKFDQNHIICQLTRCQGFLLMCVLLTQNGLTYSPQL